MTERLPVNPAIIKMQNRANDASDASHHYRGKQEFKDQSKVCMKSFNEGKAYAYNDAYETFKKELERLKREWQNGALQEDSFRTY